jgi:hypothetical protein
MPKGEENLPENKIEEQGRTLSKLTDLAPLLQLILQVIELILKPPASDWLSNLEGL